MWNKEQFVALVALAAEKKESKKVFLQAPEKEKKNFRFELPPRTTTYVYPDGRKELEVGGKRYKIY